ncbi:MAG: hypothetical protein KH230_09800 [Enterocloster asparagiformis]|nr:hypothetical protein [Enterocloster asparagiformis]
MDDMFFEAFCQYVKNNIERYLPGHKEYTIEYHDVAKHNEHLKGLSICGILDNDSAGVVIYVNDFYKDFKAGRDLEDILQEIAQVAIGASREMLNTNEITKKFESFDQIKDTLVFELTNKENKDYLRDHVHIESAALGDMAITFRAYLGGAFSVPIVNQFLDVWKVDAATLYRHANQNMPKLFPATLTTIESTLLELSNKAGIDPISKMMVEKMKHERPQMLVLSNGGKDSTSYWGAAALYYEGTQRMISETLEGIGAAKDYYILPSSTEEMLIVPIYPDTRQIYIPKDMQRVVQNINKIVDEKVRLTNSVYQYVHTKGHIVMAAAEPKSLAEQEMKRINRAEQEFQMNGYENPSIQQLDGFLRLNVIAKDKQGMWYTLKNIYDMCSGKQTCPAEIRDAVNEVAAACKAYEQKHNQGPQHFNEHTPEE